jgi:hypothetical protein
MTPPSKSQDDTSPNVTDKPQTLPSMDMGVDPEIILSSDVEATPRFRKRELGIIADRHWWPRSIREANVKEDLHIVSWPQDWRAYSTLFACFLMMFNSWGLVNAYGTFLSYYKDTLLTEQPDTLLNLIGTTECFVVLLFSGPVGRLLDAGYYPWLTGSGFLLLSVGMFSLSQAAAEDIVLDATRHIGNFGQVWVTQGLITGSGMGLMFVSSSQSKLTSMIFFHIVTDISQSLRLGSSRESRWRSA